MPAEVRFIGVKRITEEPAAPALQVEALKARDGRDGRDGKDATSRGFRLQIIRDENDLMVEVIATPL